MRNDDFYRKIGFVAPIRSTGELIGPAFWFFLVISGAMALIGETALIWFMICVFYSMIIVWFFRPLLHEFVMAALLYSGWAIITYKALTYSSLL